MAAEGAPPARRPTILVCEDEATLRELVHAVLGPGYDYVDAEDGVEGLELLRSVEPDLVVLDLMLPQLSGFEVLSQLREDPRLRHTPVVVLTAWSHLDEAAHAAGADRFLSKPFEPAALQEIVRELLASR